MAPLSTASIRLWLAFATVTQSAWLLICTGEGGSARQVLSVHAT